MLRKCWSVRRGADIREEMLPQVCAANREVFSWKKGISSTYVYDNTYGERIGELVMDERACGVK